VLNKIIRKIYKSGAAGLFGELGELHIWNAHAVGVPTGHVKDP